MVNETTTPPINKPTGIVAPISPNDFRKQLIDQGITLKEWSETRGFNPEYVSRVLTGMVKGTRGEGHKIAVAMGIKSGISTTAVEQNL